MRRRVIVLLAGPVDSVVHHPFTKLLCWFTKLTGVGSHRMARIYCVACFACGAFFGASSGSLIFAAVMGVVMTMWLFGMWRFTIPRWEQRMRELSNGYLQLSMGRDLLMMSAMRILFGSMGFTALVFLVYDLVASRWAVAFHEVAWAGYGLCGAAMYYACTTSIDPGRSAKDWVKAKAKALAAALRPPVLIPSPAGA